MNKTFKVARSLTRGTVVTSEAASSRQGKALKTVIATAAALVAGAALAEGTALIPIDSFVVTNDVTYESGELTEKTISNIELKSGTMTVKGYNDVQNLVVNGGKLVIDGGDAVGNWNTKGFGAYAEQNGSDGQWTPTEANATVVKNAEVVVNNANFFAGIAKEGVAGTKFTFDNAKVTLSGASEKTAGMIFAAGSNLELLNGTTLTVAAKNFGVVNAKNPVTLENSKLEVAGQLSFDVLAKDQDTSKAFDFNNETNDDKTTGLTTVTMTDTNVHVAGTGLLALDDVTLTTTSVVVDQGGLMGMNDVTLTNSTVVNNGTFVAGELTLTDGSTLETGYNWTKAPAESTAAAEEVKDNQYIEGGYIRDFDADTINLEGGVLKIKAQNSTAINGLVLNSGEWNLNGGVLAVGSNTPYTGAIKIGRADSAATVTIGEGASYEFSKVAFGSSNAMTTAGTPKSTLTVEGSLTVGTLDYTFGETTINGQLTADKLVWNKEGLSVAPATDGSLTIQSGATLTTAGFDNLFSVKTEGQKKTLVATEALNHLTLTGSLEITDTYTLELDDAKAYQDAVESIDKLKGKFVFTGLTITANEDAETPLSFADVAELGTAAMNTVVAMPKAEKGAVTIDNKADKKVGIAGLAVEEGTKSVEVTSNTSGLLVRGDKNANGNVFTADIDTFKVAGALDLGYEASDNINVNAKTLEVGTLNVIGNATAKTVKADTLTVNGSATATSVEFTNSAKIAEDGVLAVETIKGAEGKSLTVNGEVSANRVEAKTDVQQNGFFLFGDQLDAPKAEEKLLKVATDTTTGDAADKPAEKLAQVAGVMTFAAGSIATTSGNADSMVESLLGKDAESKAVLYVNKTLAVDSQKGQLLIGVTSNTTKDPGTVSIGQNGHAIIDVRNFKSGDTIIKANLFEFNDVATLDYIGVTSMKSLTLVDGEYKPNKATIKSSNALLNATTAHITDSTNKVVGEKLEFVFNDAAVEGLNDQYVAVLESALADGANTKTQDVIATIADTNKKDSIFVGTDGKLTDEAVIALGEYFAAPVVAGVYNVAYDAAEQVNATLARRNLEPTTGMGVWADVFYSANEGKKIYGGEQGYSADIYGGVLGFDTVFSCGAKLGAALTIGTGDADSEKSYSKYSTDADFYGLSVYTGKNVGDTNLYLSADASYLWVENDIGGNVAGASASESVDSNVFTIGARADWKLFEDSIVNVVPHIGMRYTAIDVDDYRGMESDSMNVFEVPVGVKVAGNFETNGVKVVPAFDFTVVPQVGDTQVKTLMGDVDVIDDLYNAALGVEATTGNFTFGLNYKYGFGKDDRSNNSFNANVRYTF